MIFTATAAVCAEVIVCIHCAVICIGLDACSRKLLHCLCQNFFCNKTVVHLSKTVKQSKFMWSVTNSFSVLW